MVREAAKDALKGYGFDVLVVCRSRSTGRIAVKVINHYGDEILRVYDV